MPGNTHEGLRLLLSNRPGLVRELLAMAGVILPAGELVEESSTYADLSPRTYSADLVVALDRGPEEAGDGASVVVGPCWRRSFATALGRRTERPSKNRRSF